MELLIGFYNIPVFKLTVSKPRNTNIHKTGGVNYTENIKSTCRKYLSWTIVFLYFIRDLIDQTCNAGSKLLIKINPEQFPNYHEYTDEQNSLIETRKFIMYRIACKWAVLNLWMPW